MSGEYGVFPIKPSDDMLVAGQEAWCVMHQNREAIDDCKHAEAVWGAMTAQALAEGVTVAQRIQELAAEYGSVREVANRLGGSTQSICSVWPTTARRARLKNS